MGLLEGVKETIQRSRRWSLDKVRKKKRKERERKKTRIYGQMVVARKTPNISLRRRAKIEKNIFQKKWRRGIRENTVRDTFVT